MQDLGFIMLLLPLPLFSVDDDESACVNETCTDEENTGIPSVSPEKTN